MLIDGVGIIDVGTEGEDLHGRVTHGKVGGLHAAAHSDELHLCAKQPLGQTWAMPPEPVPVLVLDKFWMDFRDLSKDQAIVHTTLRRIEEISWKLPEIAVTLHRRKETNDTDKNSINIKIVRL